MENASYELLMFPSYILYLSFVNMCLSYCENYEGLLNAGTDETVSR